MATRAMRPRVVSPKAIFQRFFGGKANATKNQASSVKKELFELLEGSERGVKNSDIRPEVEEIVDRLQEIQGDTPTTGKPRHQMSRVLVR